MRNAFMCSVVLALAASFGAAQATSAQSSQNAGAPATQAVPQNQGSSAQTAHVTTGRSMVITSAAVLKRVLVSNPAVLEAVLASPTELVISGKSAGTSSVVLWQQDGQMRILDVYSDLDVTGLREAVQQSYPDLPVRIEAEQGRVQLSGTVPNQAVSDALTRMATTYSKDVVNGLEIPVNRARAKQVMLKVRFAEVDRTRLSQWGFNLFSTGAANTPGTIGTGQFGGVGISGQLTSRIPGSNTGFTTSYTLNDLLNVFLFRPDINLGATIRALQNNSVLQVLAEPNLMAISGQHASFLAGGEFPFPVVQGLGSGNATAVTIQFRPFGVRLEFTATVDDDNQIRMKVLPEVSTLDYTNAVTISGFLIPAISTRRAETEVELHDGQSFGIAGLIDNRTTAAYSKLPMLGDLPILGQFFKSKSVNKSNTELMVLVTPTVVDPSKAAVPSALQYPIPFLDQQQYDKHIDDAKNVEQKKAQEEKK